MTRNEPLTPTSLDWLDRTRNQLLWASPLYLLVPVAFYVVYRACGITPSWAMIGVGALGWFVALTLRGPVAIVAQKLAGSQEKATTWIVASSGPLEEGLRVLALLWLGRDLSTALAIGLGWAGIEAVFAIVNALVANAMLRSDDPKVVEAREMLAQTSNTESGPWWGVLERISASALHIGNTLIPAWLPLAAIPLAVLHSAVNLTIAPLSRKAMGLAQGALALAGFLTLALGLYLLA